MSLGDWVKQRIVPNSKVAPTPAIKYNLFSLCALEVQI